VPSGARTSFRPPRLWTESATCTVIIRPPSVLFKPATMPLSGLLGARGVSLRPCPKVPPRAGGCPHPRYPHRRARPGAERFWPARPETTRPRVRRSARWRSAPHPRSGLGLTAVRPSTCRRRSPAHAAGREPRRLCMFTRTAQVILATRAPEPTHRPATMASGVKVEERPAGLDLERGRRSSQNQACNFLFTRGSVNQLSGASGDHHQSFSLMRREEWASAASTHSPVYRGTAQPSRCRNSLPE